MGDLQLRFHKARGGWYSLTALSQTDVCLRHPSVAEPPTWYQACAYLDISGSPGWVFSYLVNNLVWIRTSLALFQPHLMLWPCHCHLKRYLQHQGVTRPNDAWENARTGPLAFLQFLRTGFGNKLSLQAEVKARGQLEQVAYESNGTIEE